MSKDDLVRGKKRQRKKTPKTRSGCTTCKIRRVKCGEERPSCEKCTSTGRKCDGYSNSANSSSPQEPDADSGLVPHKRLPTGTRTAGQAIAPRTKSFILPRSPYEPTNHNPVLAMPVYTFRALPIPASMSRSFEYFLKRSSVDLAGPLCIEVWGHYILSAATLSPAIQHGIAALSGIHERHALPHSCGSRAATESWKHYYLAVKATNSLVTTSQNGRKYGEHAKEEILIACAIFITIEVLLGNFEAALRHLEGAFSLIQAYFTKSPAVTQDLRDGSVQSSPDASSNSLTTHLDSNLTDLIGFLTRLDLQMLSFLPASHSETKPTEPPTHGITQLCQPLPNATPESLNDIIKQSLSWIRHHAAAFKYNPPLPSELYDTQFSLLNSLQHWRTSYLNGLEVDSPLPRSGTTSPLSTVTTETANLLLAYHLTALKVQTALSACEGIFSTPDSMAAFEAILQYASIIVAQRNDSGSNTAAAQEGNFAQLVSFFSLEMSTIEALYYTAIKCRRPAMHRRAVDLLRIAGREGVWDGSIMARVATHVVSIEDAVFPSLSSVHSSSSSVLGNDVDQSYNDDVLLQPKITKEVQRNCHDFDVASDTFTDDGCLFMEKPLINEVTFTVDREASTVEVECGWYSQQSRSWRYDNAVLTW